MGSDRFSWDLVSDGDTTRADLAACKAKLADAEAELQRHRAAVAADQMRAIRDAFIAGVEYGNGWMDIHAVVPQADIDAAAATYACERVEMKS